MKLTACDFNIQRIQNKPNPVSYKRTQEERKFKHFKLSNNNTSIEQLQGTDNNHTSLSNYKSKKK